MQVNDAHGASSSRVRWHMPRSPKLATLSTDQKAPSEHACTMPTGVPAAAGPEPWVKTSATASVGRAWMVRSAWSGGSSSDASSRSLASPLSARWHRHYRRAPESARSPRGADQLPPAACRDIQAQARPAGCERRRPACGGRLVRAAGRHIGDGAALLLRRQPQQADHG
jgi:hypothetical protein